MYLHYSNKFTLGKEREREREKKFVGGNIISTNEVKRNSKLVFKVINVSSN